MAEVQNRWTETESDWSHTGDTSWTDVTSASISDTNFDNGSDYLILVSAMIATSDSNTGVGVKVLHGSTDFAASEWLIEPQESVGSPPRSRQSYCWFTNWTAVSGEGIKVQGVVGNAGQTVYINYVQMFALKLDDLTENTDYFFSEESTPVAIDDTTWVDGASLTISSPSGSDDYLVFGTHRFSNIEIGDNQELRINGSGGVTDTDTWESWEAEQTEDRVLQTLFWVYTPSATSTTFKVQSRLDGSGDSDRSHSKVFALRLDYFDQHVFSTDAREPDSGSITATDYGEEVFSQSYTPNQTENVLVLHQWRCNHDSTWRSFRTRLQEDGDDEPDNQTTLGYRFNANHDLTDREALFIMQRNQLSSATNWDVDASADGASEGFLERCIIACISMNPASTGQTGSANLATATASAFQPTADGTGGITTGVGLATGTATAPQSSADGTGTVTRPVNLATTAAIGFQASATLGTAPQTGLANLATASAIGFQPAADATGTVTEALPLAEATAAAFQAVGSLGGAVPQTVTANLATATATAFQPTAEGTGVATVQVIALRQ
jgi:hypothetical protein